MQEIKNKKYQSSKSEQNFVSNILLSAISSDFSRHFVLVSFTPFAKNVSNNRRIEFNNKTNIQLA